MKKIFTLFAALACVMSMSAATTRLYCKMAQDWWKADGATVGAYYWGTGSAPQWPGVRMTPVEGEVDLWYIDIDAAQFQNIIFTRVNPEGAVQDWGAKTKDLTIPTDGKNCFTITTSQAVWGDPGCDGEWSIYSAENSGEGEGGNEGGEGEGEGEGGEVTPEPQLSVVYNVTVPAGTYACYIAGEMNGWSQQEMTKVDDTHYTITLTEATLEMKYKYCSGPSWDYVEMQADGVTDVLDRTYAENDVVEAWKAVYNPAGGEGGEGEEPTPGEPKDITVKAKVPAAWTETITAWVWATGAEGQEVIPTQEGEWYVYTQNCAELNIIFKNGAGWTGDANQTVDMKFTESTCIEITAGEGKATYTVVDCPEGGNEGGEGEGGETPDPETGVTYNVTVPAGTYACYIAGEMNGWSQQEMTKVDDTHYTITIAEATTAMKYKYCSGPSWDYVEMQADGVSDVADRTYSENDVVEAWKAVYNPAGGEGGEGEGGETPDPETGVTYNVTVPAGTYACYIAGEMNGWSQQEMTKVDDTHYTITIAEATTAMKYKYCSGPSWDYVEMQADGVSDVADRTYSENDVVEAWKAVYNPEGGNEGGEGEGGETPDPETGVTYNVTVPAGTYACYIAGEMNGWSQQEMTKVDDTHYTITIAEATTAMKYKYCSGPSWDYVEMQADGVSDVADRTYSENDVVEAWKAVYNPEGGNEGGEGEGGETPNPGETKDITVKAKVPAVWTEQITIWVWATGSEGQELIPTQEGEWYVYTQNCAELNIIFKNGAGWTGDANQTVDMKFTESTCIEITAGEGKATYTVVDCPEGTAVDNVVVKENAEKFIYDGQLIIVRDGVHYNVMGQVVK